MKRKELTKTIVLISNWTKPFIFGVVRVNDNWWGASAKRGAELGPPSL